MAVRRLNEAFQRAKDMPESDQEAIAAEMLETIADLEAMRANKAEGGEPITIEQLLHEIETEEGGEGDAL
jgi:hypothetical protein